MCMFILIFSFIFILIFIFHKYFICSYESYFHHKKTNFNQDISFYKISLKCYVNIRIETKVNHINLFSYIYMCLFI